MYIRLKLKTGNDLTWRKAKRIGIHQFKDGKFVDIITENNMLPSFKWQEIEELDIQEEKNDS